MFVYLIQLQEDYVQAGNSFLWSLGFRCYTEHFSEAEGILEFEMSAYGIY